MQVQTPHQHEKAYRFKQLHDAAQGFLLPNAWDTQSSQMLAHLGFEAVSISDADILFSLGMRQTDSVEAQYAVFQQVKSIVNATNLPATIDLRPHGGMSPASTHRLVQRLLLAGAAGTTLDDQRDHADDPLHSLEHMSICIRVARNTVDAAGMPFVITAQTGFLLNGTAGAYAETVKRCNAYFEAGADCVSVLGAWDEKTIESLVRDLDGPLSVTMGVSGSPLSMARLTALGVCRVTMGGSLARATHTALRKATAEFYSYRADHHARDPICSAQLSRFLAGSKSPCLEP